MSFLKKLEFGKKYQEISKKYIPLEEETFVEDAPEKVFKCWDYRTDKYKYEVKSDRMGYLYGCATMFIEYECNNKSSGIEATQADYYHYFFHFPNNNYKALEIPVSELKEACKGCRTIIGGDGNRVKGWIVPIKAEWLL